MMGEDNNLQIGIGMMGEDNNLQTSQRKCRALCLGPRIWQTQGPDPRNCQFFLHSVIFGNILWNVRSVSP